MATKVMFSAALRAISELADAMSTSGALVEMTGSEFVAYAAEQLALSSTEPRDEAAARLSALKSATTAAAEQASASDPQEDPVVYVKLYDNNTALLEQMESLLSACRTRLAAKAATSPTSAPEAAPSARSQVDTVESAAAPVVGAGRRARLRDDTDEEEWADTEQEADDIDELNKYVTSLGAVAPARPERKTRSRRGGEFRVPPTSPNEVARLVRAGLAHSGAKLQTARSLRR